ncbi:MAG: helix-turn-helix transcriptional regulator [Actinobacteria bacterium]|nr:helix-turn-helix transcriptional regulator [Actinomycetota bacterium]
MTIEEAIAYARLDPSDAKGARALTAREAQVAGLVARGRTNREIAAALRISVRTAESHVDHILTKLGLRNRAELAAWATEHP